MCVRLCESPCSSRVHTHTRASSATARNVQKDIVIVIYEMHVDNKCVTHKIGTITRSDSDRYGMYKAHIHTHIYTKLTEPVETKIGRTQVQTTAGARGGAEGRKQAMDAIICSRQW